MRRLPILVGSKPETALQDFSSEVTLGEGKWRVVSEGVVTSQLLLHCTQLSEPVPIRDGQSFHFNGPAVVSAQYVERGKEHYISVFAEPV